LQGETSQFFLDYSPRFSYLYKDFEPPAGWILFFLYLFLKEKDGIGYENGVNETQCSADSTRTERLNITVRPVTSPCAGIAVRRSVPGHIPVFSAG
jgi:hypothetical protein